MKTAIFFNFTSEPFTGYWDGKPHTIKAGEKKYMPEYLARHFAKHLTNKILIDQGKDNYTSPKRPEQVKDFMDLFNKAFILEEDAQEQDEAHLEVDLANKIHPAPTSKEVVDNKPPQETEEQEEDDEESTFEGLN